MRARSADAVRVAMVVPWFLPRIGGAETQCYALCAELQRGNGIAVPFLLTRRIEADHARSESISGINVHRLGPARKGRLGEALFLLAAFARLVAARSSYDVVHCHTTSPLGLVSALAGRVCGKAVLLKLSTNGDIDKLLARVAGLRGRVKQWLARQAFRHAVFIALNEDGAAELRRHGATRFRVLPNGVDTGAFKMPSEDDRAALREQRRCAETDFIVVFCGRFARQKGIGLLIEAFRKAAAQERPGLKLWLIGSSRWQEECDAEVCQIGAGSDAVSVIDPVFPAAPLLQAADLFVLPSYREGMPNAALEACACGLPALLSDIAPHREFVRDNPKVVARLFKSGDAGDLRAHLGGMIADLRARSWRDRPKSGIEARFGISQVAAQYAALYRESVTRRE
jgi:glycosyltransferase involved in cell wall biosynthesis